MNSLTWTLDKKWDLFVRKMPRDYNCLFHCISAALLKTYQKGTERQRKKFVKKLRIELSQQFTEDVYNKLFDGNLSSFAKEDDYFSYSAMKETLAKEELIGYGFLSYICDKINFDIYILSNEEQAPYICDEFKYTQKNRRSIIILYSNGDHYDLIVLRNKDGIFSNYFPPSHELISYIRERNGSID